MEKQIIFEYTLADFLDKYESAIKDGYKRTSNNEDWPLFVNNGFFVGLEKVNKIVKEVEPEPAEEQLQVDSEVEADQVVKPKRGRKPSV